MLDEPGDLILDVVKGGAAIPDAGSPHRAVDGADASAFPEGDER